MKQSPVINLRPVNISAWFIKVVWDYQATKNLARRKARQERPILSK